MAEDYWKQSAKLLRAAGGMAIAPDPPIWTDADQVAEGSLSEMVERWGQLPPSHRHYHTIAIYGGGLNVSTIEGLLTQPRYKAD